MAMIPVTCAPTERWAGATERDGGVPIETAYRPADGDTTFDDSGVSFGR